MSTKFAAWLRVFPAPTTLAESSAIYQALSKQGRISTFIKSENAGRGQKEDHHGSTSTFYAVFPHEPPTLRMAFEVPVYHNLPSARDEDPFNIRGFQNRKPMPPPRTFVCVIERASREEAKSQEEAMKRRNPYHGHFNVEKDSWLQDVLVETNAPPGVPKGCAMRIVDDTSIVSPESAGVKSQPEEREKPQKINMGSLLEMWKEATSSDKNGGTRKASIGQRGDSKGASVRQRVLSADRPLGMQ